MSEGGGARSKRFGQEMDPEAQRLNASVDFDRRLLEHDAAGSIAHARMLAAQGIIPPEDAERIVLGILSVKEDLESGKVEFDPALEDVHMNVEARLIDRIGDAGRRLHTGRSRNDQVALDLRLYARSAAVDLVHLVDQLRLVLCDQAERYLDVFMPGYTHLQRAQPVPVAHHLMAYEAMLARDRARIGDAGARAGESPLGSGALAATTQPIDRDAVAAALGFPAVTRNSLDAVGDRDFAVELVAAAALCQVHLSRLAEELVLWSSHEFGFVHLSEAYCSGSSLMPQKVNPDVAELVRGKSGRTLGALVTLLTLMKGQALAYNKDNQEDKEPLFDAVDTLKDSLAIFAGLVRGLEPVPQAMRAAVLEGHATATDLADYLVRKGVPFRDAHGIVARVVREAERAGTDLASLPLPVLRKFSAKIGADVAKILTPEGSVASRRHPGGTAPSAVRKAIARARKRLGR